MSRLTRNEKVADSIPAGGPEFEPKQVTDKLTDSSAQASAGEYARLVDF